MSAPACSPAPALGRGRSSSTRRRSSAGSVLALGVSGGGGSGGGSPGTARLTLRHSGLLAAASGAASLRPWFRPPRLHRPP
eukprot:11286815-Alexandrium_andersonii.AAC.1